MQERERLVHRQAIAEWLNVAAGGVGRAGLRVATAGEASRMVGARSGETWRGRRCAVVGEDWNGVADRTVSQPCFVVGMRSQRGMTLHVSTFVRRRWHDIKTTRGSLCVYIRCHDRVFSSVASNRESVSFGGTERRVSQAVQLCGVLSPFLHLPHSSLRLEYLSVHDESVYRRLHDDGKDQWYAQNSSIEGEPTEHQLKSWVKSINKHDRVPRSLLRVILASCQIKALYKFLLLVSRRVSGNRYLEVASCNEFPAYSISIVCAYMYIYAYACVQLCRVHLSTT